MTPAPDLTISGQATIGGATLFAPLTLTLGAGQWTCLLGGSGVGKTTVLRLIAGLETGAEFTGEITASDGLPVPSASPIWRRTICCCLGRRWRRTSRWARGCGVKSRIWHAATG